MVEIQPGVEVGALAERGGIVIKTEEAFKVLVLSPEGVINLIDFLEGIVT